MVTVGFLLYTSNHCPPCIELKRRFNSIKNNIKNYFQRKSIEVKFYEFCYETDSNKFDDKITYFPYIRIIYNHKSYEYKGPKNEKNFINFIENMLFN